jgi:hypothetical protein
MKFVDTSVLDIDEVVLQANNQEAKIQRNKQSGSFEKSFRLLHDSFSDNEEEVCRAMVAGVKDNFGVVSLANVDAVVRILERLDRTQAADELIDFVVKEAPNSYWLSNDPFHRAMQSERLRKIVAERRDSAKPVLDFEKDLVESSQGFRDEKIAALAAVPQESYLKLFESKEGDELRLVVLAALEFRRIGNATPQMKEIVEKAEGALRTIGKRSVLQALRLETFGVSMSVADGADGTS